MSPGLFPYLLAVVFVVGFFAFLFFSFSGAVDTKDLTTSNLLMVVLAGLTNIALMIMGHFYSRRPTEREAGSPVLSEESTTTTTTSTVPGGVSAKPQPVEVVNDAPVKVDVVGQKP